MNKKSILSSLIFLVFGVLAVGSIDANGNIEGWFWAVVCVFVLVAIIIVFKISEASAEEKKRKEKDLMERKEKLKVQTEEYNTLKQQFVNTNGIPDKSIMISKLDLNSEIHVYEKSKKVFILGKEFSFGDILSCTYSDNPRVVKGKVTAITKSDNGSVIGRSIIGDVMAGPAGAVIGGTTGKKQTEFTQGNDYTVHDYTVIININSISDPIIRIHTGKDGTLTNEIVGLMNVILSRK